MPEQGGISYEVEGLENVEKAFKDFSKADRTQAAIAAGEALLPDIRRNSRRDTGAMAVGWDVDKGDDDGTAIFVNDQDYWTYQEFGTVDVEPMHAIPSAWERSQDEARDAYSNELKELAEDAGFGQ